MCEYCGCQALATIDELTREHDLVVYLVADVRVAHAIADTDRMAELARQIAAVLDPHTQVEERGLFPALAAEFPDHVSVLLAEHRRIEAVLGEASIGTPADRTWPQRLVDSLDMLRDHILKEQDGAFPAALSTLRTADWEAIAAVRARVGTLLPAADEPSPGRHSQSGNPAAALAPAQRSRVSFGRGHPGPDLDRQSGTGDGPRRLGGK